MRVFLFMLLWGLAFGDGESSTTSTTSSENPCPKEEGTPAINDEAGDVNYAIYYNNELPFPFAVNQCQPNLIVPTVYYKFTCVTEDDGSKSMELRRYADASCSSQDGDPEKWNATEIVEGDIGDFYCDGAYNAYSKIIFSVAADCSLRSTAYVAPAVCVNFDLESFLDMRVFCDGDSTRIQYYVDITDTLLCHSAAYCRTIEVNAGSDVSEDCNYLFSVEGPGGAEAPIYGFMDQCTLAPAPAPTTPTPTKKSGSAVASLTLALFLGIMAHLMQ